MQSQAWETIDPELDLSAQTPDGQMLAIVANAAASNWELLQISWNQFNREDVEGAGLDNVGDLVGIPREGESYTQVECIVTLDSADAPYAAGSLMANVSGLPAQTYTNVAAITATQIIAASGTPAALFQSTVIGATPPVNAGTLTVITTPVTGWSAITNPEAQTQLGSNEELDSAYGPRQEEELAAEGSCNPSATAAAIIQLGAAQTPPQTLTVSVLENTTAYDKNVNGVILPPHTYAAIIYDGGTGWASGTQLAGTVTTTNGSASITFTSSQSLAAGSQLAFAGQPGSVYTLASTVSGTSGTLTEPYTGITNVGVATVPGAGWQAIGQVIYNNKPSGITSIGIFGVTVLDPILGAQATFFSIPTPLRLRVSATITLRTGAVFTQVVAAIQAALVQAAIALTPATGIPPTGQLAPGSPVIGSQLSAVIMSVPGVQDAYGPGGPGTSIQFDFISSPTNTAPIPVNAISIATISAANAPTDVVITQGFGL
jgi:Baseplate J-like protein